MAASLVKGRRLGDGAYGIVYEATDEQQRRYAVKRNLLEPQVNFMGSLRELDVLTQTQGHPFIVGLAAASYDSPFTRPSSPHPEYQEDKLHFVFESATCNGLEYLQQHSWTAPELQRCLVQLLLALEFLHSRRLIHRDLKPANILYFAETDTFKLCDFGMAKFSTSQAPQSPRTVSSWYRAPEIVLGHQDYDEKVDLWSLGCIFFEFLTKRPLLEGVADNDQQVLGELRRRIPYLPATFLWEKCLDLPKYRIERWEQEQPGFLEASIRFLQRMLTHAPSGRATATELLADPFLQSQQAYIADIRRQAPPSPPFPWLTATPSAAWELGVKIALQLFTMRHQYRFWYKHRILFQALELWRRHLHLTTHPPTTLEEQHLEFFTCLYLSIKYFSLGGGTLSFRHLVPAEYATPENLERAAALETRLVKDELQGKIYQETPYEGFDYYHHQLSDREVENLLLLYLKLRRSFSLPVRRFCYLVLRAWRQVSSSLET